MMLNKVDIKIKFFFGELDGKSMKIKIQSDQFSETVSRDSGPLYWQRTLYLPCCLEMEFFDKAVNDTRLDENGNIVADKHVSIEGIWIDGFEVSLLALDRLIKLNTTHDIITSRYIGHNGIVILDFDKPNAFLQLASIKADMIPPEDE